jgi:hypothetical protein
LLRLGIILGVVLVVLVVLGLPFLVAALRSRSGLAPPSAETA